jgi:signal peptidase I
MSARTAEIEGGPRERGTLSRRWATLGLMFVLPVLVVVWAFTLRPQALGGPAGYVSVRGVSMEPRYHSGDLVLVLPAPAYQIGDIVAYRVPAGEIGAGIVVIHRIVGGSPSAGFVMRGDSNPDPDDWHPRTGAIVGKAWIVLPRAGAVLEWLHDPLVLASLAAGIAAATILAPRKQPGEGSAPSEA